MKAVIAVPPVEDFYFTPSRASALGPAAVKSILRRFGIEAEIFNFPASGQKAKLEGAPELEHLQAHLIPGEHGPISFFTRNHRFGPSFQDCAEQLLSRSPDIVFISCFAWAYAEESISLAKILKQNKPGLIIAAGGAGPTVNPDYFKAATAIDYVLPGEAEIILPEFVENVLNLNYIKPENPEYGTDSPGFNWFETGLSNKKKLRFISAIISRGCPKACRFCANHLVHGREFRIAGYNEIKLGLGKFPAGLNVHINFEDDNLMFEKEYFFKVLKLIRTRFPNAGFTAENGLDYNYLDSETIRTLINLGFRSFNFSMASSSSSQLLKEHRPSNNIKLQTAVQESAAAGIPSTTYFICGLEGDTVSSTVDNIAELHKLPTLTGISMYYPVPGLPGFTAERMSSFAPRLAAGSSAWPWNSSLSTEQLITAFRLSRLSNLIKTKRNMIPSAQGRVSRNKQFSELLTKIKQTGRLHTFVGDKITDVPHQDEKLVHGFLSRASID